MWCATAAPPPPSLHPANRCWPRQVEVVEAVVNENGVVRVKFDGGWVSLRTGAGEQLLEPAEPETEETKLLDELIDLYKEKNGKDPTDEEVKQWITTLKDASGASDAAAPAAGLPLGVPATPATSPAKPAAAPAFDLGAQLGSKGDLFGLDALKGQAHLKASDLGLPSFGVQKATEPAAAAAAAAPAAAAPAAPAAAAAAPAAQHSPYAQEMLALNTQFQGWVSEQLQLPGAPHDLSPGLRNYLSHAEALQQKHAAQQQPSDRPPPVSPQPAQATAAKDPAQTEAEAKAAQEAEEAEAQEKAIVRPPPPQPTHTTHTHHHHHHTPLVCQEQGERLNRDLGGRSAGSENAGTDVGDEGQAQRHDGLHAAWGGAAEARPRRGLRGHARGRPEHQARLLCAPARRVREKPCRPRDSVPVTNAMMIRHAIGIAPHNSYFISSARSSLPTASCWRLSALALPGRSPRGRS